MDEFQEKITAIRNEFMKMTDNALKDALTEYGNGINIFNISQRCSSKTQNNITTYYADDNAILTIDYNINYED